MLIPSIDLQDGHVVQLVQGERLAIEAPDPEPWIARFSTFPRVQLIDLLQPQLLDTKLFRDGAHLNPDGVKRATSLLSESVRELPLASRR